VLYEHWSTASSFDTTLPRPTCLTAQSAGRRAFPWLRQHRIREAPLVASNRCQWALAARPPSTLSTTATVTSLMVSPANAWVMVGQTAVADGIVVTAQQLIGKWDKTQPRRLRGIASCIDWKALMYRQFRRMLWAE
jgi:hypothetical protein